MIRLRDAVVLALTKLRTHKIRTGITVGVAGILFGIIFGGVFVAQGIFESINRFDEEGLADRSIVLMSKYDNNYFDAYDHMEDSKFVAEVKKAHADRVAIKTAAAKKYSIEYDPKIEDPSPIEIDKTYRMERIKETAFDNEFVQQVAVQRANQLHEPLDINSLLETYVSAKILSEYQRIRPIQGSLVPMENGKEKVVKDNRDMFRNQFIGDMDAPNIQVVNDSIAAPFVMQKDGKVPSGELPAVVSFSYAEKLLSLKKLARDSTNEQRLARLDEVRSRIGEVTASFCYRNPASLELLARATTQHEEIERTKANKDYEAPKLIYALPAEDSCGATTVATDTRSALEKQVNANFEAYQKEIGLHPGEPEQHKLTLRAIGLSGDAPDGAIASGASEMVMGMLGSWLSYGATWTIPSGLLAEAPEHLRPAAIFSPETPDTPSVGSGFFNTREYMVEFSDKSEAREALKRGEIASGGGIYATPYGSGMLIVDQVKQWFLTGLFWSLSVVGGVALVILASLIGRMVSDGRRESAVFRAIGARRSDIGKIYGMYALLLSLRVAIFALILGLVISFAAELWLGTDATVGARLAYAATDTNKAFRFISIGSWYVPAMLLTIVATGLVASITPILNGARRSPINDMRDDT